MKVAETFEVMQASFRPPVAAESDFTFQWNISGSEAGEWAFIINHQTCEMIPGGIENPDLNLMMSDADWLSMNEGQLDYNNAIATARIRMAGDTTLAIRLPELFPTFFR
jgi:putative sterol carrier protein